MRQLKRRKSSNVKAWRLKIWTNGNGICHICNKPVSLELFTKDHVIPKSKGGKNTIDNLFPSHQECNWKKANKILTKKE